MAADRYGSMASLQKISALVGPEISERSNFRGRTKENNGSFPWRLAVLLETVQ